ncbi:MAG: trypsin-like peptidase domain-containing protein [Caldimonas sp.]
MAFVIVTMATGCAALGAPARATLPDFTSYVSREEAVVVAIKAVAAWMPFMGADDPEDPLLLDGTVAPVGSRIPRAAIDRSATRSQASGIVISSDGYILTSAHAVADIEAASIVLADGRELEGRIIGIDTPSDVALMKIEASASAPPASAIRAASPWATGSLRSALPSAWAPASRPASSARADPFPAGSASPSSRATWRPIRAAREEACSTSRARSSA